MAYSPANPNGQATAANSAPVVIASDQSAFAVSLAAGATRAGQVQLTGSATASALGIASSITAYGNLRVTTEPSTLFNDPFDGAVIDTTNRWNAATVSGMTVAQASGGLVITGTLVAGNSAYIDTQPTFAPLGVNFTAFAAAVKLEAQTGSFFTTNAHRFFGLGNRPATFAIGTPLLDAIGFEIDTTGQLLCCVYSNGTRVYSTTTSLTGVNLNTLVTPSNGFCRFGMALRADTLVFYIGTTEFPAASFSVSSASFALPNVQALPIRAHSINSATAPAAAAGLTVTTLAIGDTGGNGFSINDGMFGWRKAGVTAKGLQGGFALTTQNLKDAGRVARNFILDTFTAAPVADALQSVAQWYNNAAVAATTQPAVVPAGKTLRLIGWRLETKSLATVGSVVVRCRANTAGLVVIGSPQVFSFSAGSIAGSTTVAMTGAMGTMTGLFPEGMELPAGTGIGFSLAGYGPTGVLTLQVVTRFEVWGFEY